MCSELLSERKLRLKNRGYDSTILLAPQINYLYGNQSGDETWRKDHGRDVSISSWTLRRILFLKGSWRLIYFQKESRSELIFTEGHRKGTPRAHALQRVFFMSDNWPRITSIEGRKPSSQPSVRIWRAQARLTSFNWARKIFS
jgi:hypothetical protein